MGCCGGSNNGGLNGRSGGFGGELQEGGSEGLADPDGFKECRSSGDATEAKQRLRVSTGHRERQKEGKSGQTVRAYTSCRRVGDSGQGLRGRQMILAVENVGVVTMLYLHGWPLARCDTCGIRKTERHGRMCVTEAKVRPEWGWWIGKGE